MIIQPDFHPKQKLAMRALMTKDNAINEVLYGGSAGSGKSWLGCVFILSMGLMYKGTRYLIGRNKLTHLKQTTLRTFFDVCKQFNLKEGLHYNYNAQSNIITLNNGSEIFLKELFQYPSDPDFDSLGSLEITAAFIDEVPQITEKAKNIVMSRIRYKLDENGIEPKLYMSCNPSKGWLFKNYYKKDRDGELEDYKLFIKALPTDNPHISKHYINNLKKLDKVSRERLLEGIWEYSNDLGIFDYDAILAFLNNPYYYKEEDKQPQHYMSVDVARLGKDSTVIWVMDENGVLKDFTELKKKNTVEVVGVIKQLKKKWNILNNGQIAVDSDGVGGGVVDQLVGVKSIINNATPINKENYQNLKTQLYAKLAEKINMGELYNNIQLPLEVEEKLTQEMNIIERVNIDKDGKVQYTPKDIIKKKIGRSPDYSDALAYMMVFFLQKVWVDEIQVDLFY